MVIIKGVSRSDPKIAAWCEKRGYHRVQERGGNIALEKFLTTKK